MHVDTCTVGAGTAICGVGAGPGVGQDITCAVILHDVMLGTSYRLCIIIAASRLLIALPGSLSASPSFSPFPNFLIPHFYLISHFLIPTVRVNVRIQPKSFLSDMQSA